MKLSSTDAKSTLSLRIAGYQFPGARNPDQRYSWHMISGSAVHEDESWQFRYPALTGDESARLSAWLRAVADRIDSPDRRSQPERLTFTEPNLAVDLVPGAEDFIDVELNLESARRAMCLRLLMGTPRVCT